MADDKSTDAQPAAQPTKATRKSMAPTARDPRGTDDPAPAPAERYGWLADLEDSDLDELADAMRAERRRRGRVAREPSFGMSEGERDELERTGKTVSPFTGEVRTKDDTAG